MGPTDWDALLRTNWLESVQSYLDAQVGPHRLVPMIYDERFNTVVLLVGDDIALPFDRSTGTWHPPQTRQSFFGPSAPRRTWESGM